MRKLAATAVLTLLLLASSVATASAEWLFTPYAGYNWGGAVKVNDFVGSFEDRFGPWVDFGATVTWPKGALGFEFDFGYHPQFLEKRTDEDNVVFPSFNWANSRVMTFMGNVSYSPGFLHLGKLRGFASGGAGLIHIHAADALIPDLVTIDSRTLGVNAGGGVTLPFTGGLQLRGDVRYFRSLENKDPSDPLDTTMGNLYFWRSTVGVTFRF
jgi:opacity protein-like surface antigen